MKGFFCLFSTPFIALSLTCPAQGVEYRRLADEELSHITAQASPDFPENFPSVQDFFQDIIDNSTGYTQIRMDLTSRDPTLYMQFDLTQEVSWDTFYYGSNAPGSAYSSLCDVYYKMRFFTPDDGILSSTASYGPTLLHPNGPSVSKLRLEAKHVNIVLEEARIGDIRIGNAPGEGKSFGSIILSGAHMDFSGIIEIWPH